MVGRLDGRTDEGAWPLPSRPVLPLALAVATASQTVTSYQRTSESGSFLATFDGNTQQGGVQSIQPIMCIILFTTSHPDYSLILLDNRDEFILRPTSRPHWWMHPGTGQQVLSARDLQRAEKGTWLAITKCGSFAALTNYREPSNSVLGASHPSIRGVKSRGGMVLAWLDAARKGSAPEEGQYVLKDGSVRGGEDDGSRNGAGRLIKDGSVRDGVHHLLKDGSVQSVGGFSMVCGKLRKKRGGIAVVSNRASKAADVPLVAHEKGETWGLSNTTFEAQEKWPKVEFGTQLLRDAVQAAVEEKQDEQDLIRHLFGVLDTETYPAFAPDWPLDDMTALARHSIFVPPLGNETHWGVTRAAQATGKVGWPEDESCLKAVEETLPESQSEPSAAPSNGFQAGLYGTQRQTVVLVDCDGNVKMVERALWDRHGNEIPRGEGDVVHTFRIDGWEAG